MPSNTHDDSQDKAVFVANQIVQSIEADIHDYEYNKAVEFIAAALRQAHDEAIEQAVSIAIGMGDEGIANTLRALKTNGGATGER